MKILMAASENDALPNGKVGGIGDVVRDVPPALAQAGHQVHVVTPGYQAFSRLPGARFATSLPVTFAGWRESVDVFEVPSTQPVDKVTLWALEHPIFAAGGAGKIYCDDPPGRPFATDATKFALFSAAVAKAVIGEVFGAIDVLHLHDWHTAMVAMLRAFAPEYRKLQAIHTVYTIHNLALQGVRPLAGDDSSLEAWFPGLAYDQHRLADPHVAHCVNPMRAGINFSDRVHAVSPTYAREILLPSNPEQGYFGGEGLQQDLQRAADEGRLHGILNGCEYPEQKVSGLPLNELLLRCENELLKLIAGKPAVESAHLIASKRIAQQVTAANSRQPQVLVTSVGRITDQKVRLLLQPMNDGAAALDHLLQALGERGLLIMLGSGDSQLEQFLTQVAGRQANFIFIKGYAENLSQYLYASGDLFLMPSSYEPCGISQMLAMRAGQPCLVHRVGGLSDTVNDGVDGFVFAGDSLREQAENMVACFKAALQTRCDASKWEKISGAAAAARFLWSQVAEDYIRLLYTR